MPADRPEPDLPLLFEPFVHERANTIGWTAERQIAFIAALARTGVVRPRRRRSACRRARPIICARGCASGSTVLPMRR
jgi:hypothetical protein